MMFFHPIFRWILSLSWSRFIVLSLGIGAFFFVLAERTVSAQINCDKYCEYIHCWADGFPTDPNCGDCGQADEWRNIYNVQGCSACGAGICHVYKKDNPDQCSDCWGTFIQQCLTCA